MRQAGIIGDEQAWIARRFLAQTWFGWGGNALHCAQTRGRMAASCSHLYLPICDKFAATTGSLVIPVYSAGCENRYSLRAVFGAHGLPMDDRFLSLELDSTDEAGANASAAQPAVEVTIGPGASGLPWTGQPGPDLLPWPSPIGADMALDEFPSGTLTHLCAATLPPGVRLLTLSWAWVGGHKPDAVVYLVGLHVVGYSEEVP